MNKCVLEPCRNEGGELVRLTQRGINTIIQCSEIRQDGVKDLFVNNVVREVHPECRKWYTRNPKPPSHVPTPQRPTRSATFDFKTHCFFCGRKCIDVTKCRNPSKEEWSEVRTLGILHSVRNFANAREDDEWGREVLHRLSGVIDLVAAEGRYHRYCYATFQHLNTSKPGEGSERGGSRESKESVDAFDKFWKYLEENDECQYSVTQLQEIFSALNLSLIHI